MSTPVSGARQTRELQCEATVLVRVSPDAPADWLSRVTEPGFPYQKWNGDPLTEAEGLEILAHNALANGVQDASRLDGWADLPRGAVELDVQDVEVL